MIDSERFYGKQKASKSGAENPGVILPTSFFIFA